MDLKPWIARALLAGRKPLPDAAPKRAPIPKSIASFQINFAPPAHVSPKRPKKLQRRPWTTAELKHLFRLKDRDSSWEAIQSYFPERSIDAIKQTFWKHRSYFRSVKSARKKRLRTIQGFGVPFRLDTIAEETDAQNTVKINSPTAPDPAIPDADTKEKDDICA
ncbi:hypothetical protein ESCO_001973 [Escovopsis weberi]|uniref:Myb-like domain-containing protein n=1 Tax=Escovopsis weberi TaxID=150374 RepID=A0A0M8N0F9_ESCWE|nr:hypothetical protein ESCO_001973 [Escovopsis weberi]